MIITFLLTILKFFTISILDRIIFLFITYYTKLRVNKAKVNNIIKFLNSYSYGFEYKS